MNAKIGLLVMGVSLAGCAGVSLTAFEQTVQSDVAAACSFLPTLDSIAAIFHNSSIALQAPEAIAALICHALPAPPAGLMNAAATGPVAFPVVIQGQRFKITGQRIGN